MFAAPLPAPPGPLSDNSNASWAVVSSHTLRILPVAMPFEIIYCPLHNKDSQVSRSLSRLISPHPVWRSSRSENVDVKGHRIVAARLASPHCLFFDILIVHILNLTSHLSFSLFHPSQDRQALTHHRFFSEAT